MMRSLHIKLILVINLVFAAYPPSQLLPSLILNSFVFSSHQCQIKLHIQCIALHAT